MPRHMPTQTFTNRLNALKNPYIATLREKEDSTVQQSNLADALLAKLVIEECLNFWTTITSGSSSMRAPLAESYASLHRFACRQRKDLDGLEAEAMDKVLALLATTGAIETTA